jgi:hypothetical protein
VSEYLRLHWLFQKSPREACSKLTAAALASIFANLDQEYYAGVSISTLFTAVVKFLEDCGRSDVSTALKQQLSPSLTGVPRFSWFSSQSSWHANVAKKIVDAIVAALCHTHFPEKLAGICKIHAPKIYGSEINQSSALKKFLENCTLAQAETVCRELALEANTRNERVRSARKCHHAEVYVQAYVRIFKLGVAALQDDTSELSRLDAVAILSGIVNKRAESESTERRTFTVGEMDAMLEASKCDTRHTLLLRLLREVGLRVACLSNLKYGMLLDESHIPRHVCRVPEKNKSWRSFVTSTALKQAIISLLPVYRSRVYIFVSRKRYLVSETRS